MKNLKFFGFTLVLVANVLLSDAHAAELAKKPEVSQIQSYLSNVNFADYVKSDMKMSITFMVNKQDEIVVVTTSHPELDALVKATLNYKKLNMGQLEYNVLYTLPVSIRI